MAKVATKLNNPKFKTIYQNNPGFDIIHHDFHNEGGLKKFKSQVTPGETEMEELKTYQRLLRLDPREKVAEKLIANGLVSAQHIAAIPANEFVKKYKSKLGLKTDELNALHQKANDVKARTMLMWGNAASISNAPRNAAFNTRLMGATATKHFQNLPGYQDMFGSLNYCDCESCKSIFGPAAYYVDLMRIIDCYITTPSAGKIPKNLSLKDRRPDLFSLPLTCENTSGLIPYLEVVNETLAAQVKKALSVTDARLGVANAVYPFNLPVNLPQKNINAYLQELNSGLSDVYKALKINPEGWAKAYLTISQEWFQLISKPTTDETKLKAQYGMSSSGANWKNEVSVQKNFLFQTDLSFNELSKLFTGNLSQDEIKNNFAHKFFINQTLTGNSYIYLKSNEEQPELSTLVNLNNLGSLDRVNRFIRLAKMLNLSFAELNDLLSALGATDIDSNSITAIAQIKNIRSAREISLETMGAIVNDMNTFGLGAESAPLDLFDQVFNNPFTAHGQAAYHPVYKPNPMYTDKVQEWVINTKSATSGYFGPDRLSAALSMSSKQLTQMATFIWGATATVKLNVPNLSLMYRHSVLLKILNLSVADYFILLKLNKLPLDKAFNLTQLQQLLESAAWTEKAGMSPQQINFILTGEPNEQVHYSFGLKEVKTLMTAMWSLAPGSILNSAGFEKPSLITSDVSKKVYSFFVGKNVIKDLTAEYSSFMGRKMGNETGIALRLPTQAEITELDKLIVPDNVQAFNDYIQLVLTKKIEEQNTFLAQQLGAFIGTPNDTTLALMNWATAGENPNSLMLMYTPLNNDSEAEWKQVNDYLKYMSRYQLLVSQLRLGASTVQSIVFQPAAYNISNLSTLAFNDIRNIYQLQQLINKYNADAIIAYFAMPSDTTCSDGKKAAALSKITQWPEDQICSLLAFFKEKPALYDTLAGVLSLASVFDITIPSGTDVKVITNLSQLNGLPVNGKSSVDTKEMSNWEIWQFNEENILQSLKAKYNEKEWKGKSRTLNEQTLPFTRNAYLKLVTWYLHQTYPDIAYARNVSEYLLMDVETSGCSDISYVKQGLLALQMYMQRCRMGIEIGANTHSIPEVWWEWMMNYRLWEANRKVFLYPENYIAPGLRIDESSVYKELKDALLQSDITPINVRTSYINYFNGFANLANLVDAGNYRCKVADSDTPEPTDTIFFFGRTHTKPYIYYYRKCINPTSDYPVWTYWEKINAKVTSDHIAPLFAFNKLFLFWVDMQTTDQSVVKDNNTIKNTIFQSKLYYSFYDFSKEWVQEQYLNDNYTIFSWPNQYISDLTNWINDLGIDFSKNKLYWRKAYPMSLKDGDGKDMILMTYGDVFNMPKGTTKNPPKPDPNTASSPEQASFNQNLYEAIVRANKAANAGMSGYNVLTPSVIIKPNLQLDETVTILQDIITGTPNPYRAKIDSAKGELQMIESENVIVDNYYGDMGDNFGQYQTTTVNLLSSISLSNSNTLTLKNHPGSFVFSNGDESFLSLSQQEVKPISDILKINHNLASSNETDLLTLSYTDKPEALKDIKFKFLRIADAAIEPLSNRLFMGGVEKLLTIESQSPFDKPVLPFSRLKPTVNVLPPAMPDGAQVDFKGSYGPYYWEVFFHIPFLIAKNLTANRQFREAQKWYEFIFNPTNPISKGLPSDVPEQNKYWYFYPFRIQKSIESIKENLTNEAQITAYNNHPYDPHAIANLRIGAYEKSIVMNYIENILDWADDLFSQDSWESITEAITLYLLAYDLLGKRPEEVGTCSSEDELVTFQKIEDAYKGKDIPQFLIELESKVHNTTSVQLTSMPFNDIDAVFCVPENDYLLKLWDRIEGNLYKIRNCMNIDGQVRSLALFEPPIDVFQLVSAVATSGGKSPMRLLQQLNGNDSSYRFLYLVEKAKSVTSTVMDFGAKLLSALEKKDAEELVLLLSSNQATLLSMITKNKQSQIEAAQNNLDALKASLKSATDKFDKYTGWLQAGLISNESANLDALAVALGFNIASTIAKTASSILYSIPQVGSPFAITYGGVQLGNVSDAIGAVADMGATAANYVATTNQIKGSYKRRDEEWELQIQLAQDEMDQINEQIKSQEVQLSIAKQELKIHNKQMEQEQQVQEFHQNKFTNKTLYQWMIGRLSTLYYQMYQLAQEMAMSAQQAFQYELNTNDSFINFGYWDSLKKGLLAGEGLMLAVDQMAKAYTDKNDRRLEIEKTVSLIELDPYALINLKTKGKCTFSLNEKLFAYDYPGHYCRRIKNITISIPAVVGPYQNLKASLTQKSNKIVLEPSSKTVEYLMTGKGKPEEGALSTNWRSNQHIALSSGVNDSGMFELNFNDERYLPFEGTGAISEWELQMPLASNYVNFESISDVIIKVNYTALDGGSDYYKQITALSELQKYSNSIYYNCNQNFASQWYKFLNDPPVSNIQKLSFSPGKSIEMPHIDNTKVNLVYLQLDVANNASVQSAKPFLSLKIGNQADKEITLTNNYACIRLSPEVSASDYLKDWKISVNLANAPATIVKDSKLNPDILKNMELIIVSNGQLNWQEAQDTVFPCTNE